MATNTYMYIYIFYSLSDKQEKETIGNKVSVLSPEISSIRVSFSKGKSKPTSTMPDVSIPDWLL